MKLEIVQNNGKTRIYDLENIGYIEYDAPARKLVMQIQKTKYMLTVTPNVWTHITRGFEHPEHNKDIMQLRQNQAGEYTLSYRK